VTEENQEKCSLVYPGIPVKIRTTHFENMSGP